MGLRSHGDGGLASMMGLHESEANAKRTLNSLRDPLHRWWVCEGANLRHKSEKGKIGIADSINSCDDNIQI